MKVKELISKLETLDPNLEIYCYEDESFEASANPGPFDIIDAACASAIVSRDTRTGKVKFKFEGDIPGSRKIAIISVTQDI